MTHYESNPEARAIGEESRDNQVLARDPKIIKMARSIVNDGAIIDWTDGLFAREVRDTYYRRGGRFKPAASSSYVFGLHIAVSRLKAERGEA